MGERTVRIRKVKGSNPSVSTTSSQALYRLRRLFMLCIKSHLALTPLLLLSKSNPLRWASIWFFGQGLLFILKALGFESEVACLRLAKSRLRRLLACTASADAHAAQVESLRLAKFPRLSAVITLKSRWTFFFLLFKFVRNCGIMRKTNRMSEISYG